MSLNSEQTIKVKNAVKAKLVEIGAYVDDQLSDYVMIMITNKKTEKQMTEDLELFLGGMQQSADFSTWLHSYIKKLTTVQTNEKEQTLVPSTHQYKKQSSTSKLSSRKSNSSLSSVTTQLSSSNNQQESDELAIQIDSNEFNDDLNDEFDRKQQSRHKKTSPSKTTRKTEPSIRKEPDTPVKTTPVKQQSPDISLKIRETSPQQSEIKSKVTVVSSKVIAVNKSEPEDEDLDKNKTRLSSVIKVSDRKYNVPKSMQPNKSILLKAVDDANRSSSSSHRVKSIADEKLALIRSKRFANNDENIDKSESSRHEHQERHYSKREEVHKRLKKKSISPVSDKRHAILNESSLDADFGHVSKQTQNLFLNIDRRQVHIETELKTNRIAVTSDQELIETDEIMDQTKEPKFIVTLTGLDDEDFMKRLTKTENKRTLSDMEDDEMLNQEEQIEDDEQNQMDADTEDSRIKNKKLIRCTFWPQCDKGDQCPYLHPNKPCTTFPSCQFGQKCHYLHPSCRYDGICSRLDCIYTHLIKKPTAVPIPDLTKVNEVQTTTPTAPIDASVESPSKAAYKSTPKVTINKIQSTYFNPNEQMETGGMNNQFRRSAPNVPYYKTASSVYPFAANQYALVNRTTNPASVIITPCKYGNVCKNPKCIYTHPNLPQVSQLKWTAALQNSTNLNNTQLNVMEQTVTDSKMEAKLFQS